MAKRFEKIEPDIKAFIEQQPIFFVATATAQSRINLSPKGLDSLRVLGENRVIWRNLTGSGNETAAHLAEQPRMTLMFTSFSGPPLILRLYGTAHTIFSDDPQWDALLANFDDIPGSRQIFDMRVDLVQTSCGYGVPEMELRENRKTLVDWAAHKTPAQIEEYHKKRNHTSIDGAPIPLSRESLI